MVSTWGRVYNTKTNQYVPRELYRNKNMYINIALKDINNIEFHIPVHRLLAELFIFPKPVSQNGTIIVVNHKDGVKWHNELYNLEWATQSENAIHAVENNLIARPFGEYNGNATLSDKQYHEICRLTEEGYLPYQINNILNYGFDITNICQKIRSGKSETIISEQYDFSNIKRNDYRKFTEDEVRYICLCLQDYPNLSYKDILIGLEYDVDNMDYKEYKKLRDTISTIKRRVSYISIGNEYNF